MSLHNYVVGTQKKDLNEAFFLIQYQQHTVSHFSYAPPFQGPHILAKMLESTILYDHLRIDILSD